MDVAITSIPDRNPMKPGTLCKVVEVIPSAKDNQALLSKRECEGTDIILDNEDLIYWQVFPWLKQLTELLFW